MNIDLSVLRVGPWSWRRSLVLILQAMAVVLPIVFYLRTYDSCMVKITILQLGTLAALAVWLFGSLREGRLELPEKALPVLLPAGLLLLWNVLRFASSPHGWASLHGFSVQVCFLLAFILAASVFRRSDARRGLLVVTAGWVVVVLYGVLQKLGLDPFIWKGAFGPRVFSTMGNPNFLAAYLLVCAPVSMAWAFDEELPRGLRWSAAALAALGCAVLGWTGSVLEVLLCAAVMALFAALAHGALPQPRRKAAAALAAACALAAVLGAGARTPDRPKHTDYNLSRQRAFLPETWKGTLSLIREHPLFGAGPGSFWIEYPAFRRPGIILFERKHNTETDHPENELLEQWADGGLAALGLWLWLFAALLGRCRPKKDGLLAAAALASLAAALAAMLVGNAGRFAVPGWHIYFIAGLLAALCLDDDDGRGRVLAVLVAAGAGAAGWAVLRGFQSDLRLNYAIYWSKSKEWDKALLEYGRMAPWAPAYVMGQYFTGNVLHDRAGDGDLEAALAQYRRVRELAPNYVQVHYQEGQVLRKLGRLEEAAARFEAQAALDPVWDQAWQQLADVYRGQGKTIEADAAARSAAEAKRRWEAAAP